MDIFRSILLVDFTIQLSHEVGEIRFLPMVLTLLMAIGSLIPIALSSNPLISLLALVIIGGFISSTVLSNCYTGSVQDDTT